MKSTNIQINYDEKTIPQKVQLFLEKRNSGKAENKHVWEQADSSRKRTEPNYQAKTEKKDGAIKLRPRFWV